jgi:hypothetical protein
VCIAGLLLALVPRWAAHARWRTSHLYAILTGAIVGSMAVGSVGFIGSTALDFYGKVVLDLIATMLLIALGMRGGDQFFRSAARWYTRT